MTPDEPFIRPQDVANLCDTKLSWVYARAEDKTLPHYKIGKYLRFRKSEILAWRERQRVGTAPTAARETNRNGAARGAETPESAR
jgi:excisionase family DNA binding protein